MSYKRFKNLKIAFTGIRALHPEEKDRVRRKVRKIAEAKPKTLIFGGAIGTDTLTLLAAIEFRRKRTEIVVIVPGTVDQQPMDARIAIRTAAKMVPEDKFKVVELGLDVRNPGSYYKRNVAMLTYPADYAVGFWDGTPGGTKNCLQEAAYRNIPTKVYKVRKSHMA